MVGDRWEPIMSTTPVLLQRRGVYVSGSGKQGTDQEPTRIENIKLSILGYTRRRPSEGMSIMGEMR